MHADVCPPTRIDRRTKTPTTSMSPAGHAQLGVGLVAIIRDRGSLAEPDPHTKSGRESGDTRILSWFCTVSKSAGN